MVVWYHKDQPCLGGFVVASAQALLLKPCLEGQGRLGIRTRLPGNREGGGSLLVGC